MAIPRQRLQRVVVMAMGELANGFEPFKQLVCKHDGVPMLLSLCSPLVFWGLEVIAMSSSALSSTWQRGVEKSESERHFKPLLRSAQEWSRQLHP